MDNDRPHQLPDYVLDVLANADRFELLSLDPGVNTREAGHFWGWRVLGSATIESQASRGQIVDALQRGIAENTGWMAACFIPRHGIRAVRGNSSVDVVACFECAQAYVYTDAKWIGSVLVSASPEPLFDRLLTESGVTLASKSF